MSVPGEIVRLVETFGRNREVYKSSAYNETQVRREFLDPLFGALGWDVDNEKGYAHAYKDVIHEDAVKVGGVTKAPDYCFRIGGVRKFFLEAKRPGVDLKHDMGPAFQLRRYAWSAKLPLSVLSDFEEFAVYDTRVRPVKTDRPGTARVKYITFEEYPDRWGEIEDIFSREAILRGGFDKYAASGRRKKGTAEVDQAFLAEIEGWRDSLARHLALRNKELSNRQLNFAVQRTIDRLIFLRICEDRGIEVYGQLQGLLNGGEVYQRLVTLYDRADERYNSGLFHFHAERGRVGEADELTQGLSIDDKVLKEIIKHLYYPESPYEFSVLGADILGQVYEQFLGKVITLTAGHRAKVEDKPEVKKAGGVYYTPTYIVDYIVKQTVGKLLEGRGVTYYKTRPAALKGTLRVLDPACGSGSFLIGAYQYLLDWYLRYYTEHEPAKWAGAKYPTIVETAGDGARGNYRLTTAERKRILLEHVFGVDIDSQAVEVTKLSLLLKVLEGESQDSLDNQLRLFHERALPDLSDNIKCGNSLIGPDFYEGQQGSLFGEEDYYRINAFDWRKEFAAVFAGENPGFDAVIGNPPYLYSAGQNYQGYFCEKYKYAEYQTDFYVYFIEKALRLGRRGGKFSFIVSDSWLNSESFSTIRNHLLEKHCVSRLAVFDYPVFSAATLENSIFLLTIESEPSDIQVERFSSPTEHSCVNTLSPKDAIARGIIDPRYSRDAELVIKKMEREALPLSSAVKINRGIHAYRTDGYGQSRFGKGPQTKRDKQEASYHADSPVDETYIPELKGKHVFRYTYESSGRYISYGPWLAEPRTRDFFLNPKIALRKILGPKLHGTLVEPPCGLDQSLYILVDQNNNTETLHFLLGVLLSRLGAWYLRTKYAIYDTLYPWYTKKQLAGFPVKPPDVRITTHVKHIIELHKRFAMSKTPDERKVLERQIGVVDGQIDRLVYALYGLTEEEIRIVEDKS